MSYLNPGRHFPCRNCVSDTQCLILHLSELHTCSRAVEGVSLEITHSINTQVLLTDIFLKALPSRHTSLSWYSCSGFPPPLYLMGGNWSIDGWLSALWSTLTWGKPISISHCWHLSQQMQEFHLEVAGMRIDSVRRFPLWSCSGLISKAVFNLSAASGCFHVHLHSRRRQQGKSQGKFYSFLPEILLIIRRICSSARKIVNQVLSTCII